MRSSKDESEFVFSQPPYKTANTKAPIKRARIVEDLCIGCTRCIKICPTDSISGASKFMHTIIQDHCSGCQWCLSVCPTDCIEMVQVKDCEKNIQTEVAKLSFYRSRYLRKINSESLGDKSKPCKEQIDPTGSNVPSDRVLAALQRAAKLHSSY